MSVLKSAAACIVALAVAVPAATQAVYDVADLGRPVVVTITGTHVAHASGRGVYFAGGREHQVDVNSGTLLVGQQIHAKVSPVPVLGDVVALSIPDKIVSVVGAALVCLIAVLTLAHLGEAVINERRRWG